jgi:hypothetical protein
MDRVACVQVTAEWSPAAPDVEPPDFARQVWPGFRTGTFAISRVVVRHDTDAERKYWRSFSRLLDLRKRWSAVDWTDQLPEPFRKRVYESTSGHLNVFFRQTIDGAAKVRDQWRHWPLATVELSMLHLGDVGQSVVREIVEAEAKSELLLTLWGERETALWLGEEATVSTLQKALP